MAGCAPAAIDDCDLPADLLGGGGAHHRPEGRFRRCRVAEHVAADQLDRAVDEVVMDTLVHVDALDAAAGLPAIEVGTVDQVLDRVLDVRIVPDVRRIATAQFQPSADESLRRGMLHGVPTGHGAGECDEPDAWITDGLLGRGVRQVHRLEHALGQPRLAKALRETLGAERRLGGVLEHHGIAGHDRRNDAVHGDQVGIVPGRDRQDDAERLAADEAREALARSSLDVRQRFRGDVDHVACPLQRAAHLAGRKPDRPAHLPGQFQRDGVAPCLEFLAELAADRRPGGQARHAPRPLRRHAPARAPDPARPRLPAGARSTREPSTGETVRCVFMIR